MSSHPSTTSSARLRPMRRGSRTVPPAPGTIPMATSGWLKMAFGVANRMSHPSASSLPPPPTRPSITAMVGLGMVRRVSHISSYGPIAVGIGWTRGNCWMASTSKCARNHSGLAERITTARTDSSSASSWIAAPSSKNTSMVIRLIGGWSTVSVATPRSSTTVRTAVIAYLRSRCRQYRSRMADLDGERRLRTPGAWHRVYADRSAHGDEVEPVVGEVVDVAVGHQEHLGGCELADEVLVVADQDDRPRPVDEGVGDGLA